MGQRRRSILKNRIVLYISKLKEKKKKNGQRYHSSDIARYQRV